MMSAGIKELKNQLSRYLSFVKKGEDVLITERGKVIARIIFENPHKTSLRKTLHPLIMQGLITYPTNHINKNVPDPVEIPGKPVSEMAIEDRR